MSPVHDGYVGPRDGPFRGEHLVCCLAHGGWWTKTRPCPACALQRENDALKARLKDLEPTTRR